MNVLTIGNYTLYSEKRGERMSVNVIHKDSKKPVAALCDIFDDVDDSLTFREQIIEHLIEVNNSGWRAQR